MPSGKTHDAVTLLLAVPTFAVAWGATASLALACVVVCSMLFGGFMFGPDLDIQSRQYTRWGVFRFLWWPYKVMFRHRSRWSHGILFGTLIRVVYFAAMLSLIAAAAIYLRAVLVGGAAAPTIEEIAATYRTMEIGLRHYSGTAAGAHVLWALLAGLWWGAASHTLTDVAWSMLRKSSEIF